MKLAKSIVLSSLSLLVVSGVVLVLPSQAQTLEKSGGKSGEKSVEKSAEKSAEKSGEMPFFCSASLVVSELQANVRRYEREPNNQVAFFNAAHFYLARRDYVKVDQMAHAALKAHPNWASPYYVLAKVAEAQLEDEQCLEYYQKALKASPHWSNLFIVYADKLNTSERFADSLSVCNTGLKYMASLPKDPEVAVSIRNTRYIKSQALYNLKDYSAAAKEIEMSGIEEDILIRQKFLAECYLKSKQFAKGLAVSDKLCKASPSNYSYHFIRAQFYSAMGQPQKCVDELTVCLKLKRFQVKNIGLGAMKVLEDRDALLLRAAEYEKLGKKDLAQKDRNTLKAASESSYKEAAFRSGR